MKKPPHCKGCREWDKKDQDLSCHLIYENLDKNIVYPMRCDKCGRVEKTCWMAILPDGWRFCYKLEGIACGGCCEKWDQVLFDDKNYEVLERIEW